MNLKEELKKAKEKLCGSNNNISFKDYDFSNKKCYRLHFVNYYNRNQTNLYGVVDWPFQPFLLPDGMNVEEAFKILSYLTDFIESDDDIKNLSFQAVSTLDYVLNLKRFGFKRIDFQPNEEEIADLFTIVGRVERFKNSKYNEKYFEWYIPNVTKDEIEKIYTNHDMEFVDLIKIGNSKSTNDKVKKL